MRVLLQDTASGKYLTGTGQWVDSPGSAADFIMVRTARAVAEAKRLGHFRPVVYFPGANGGPGSFFGGRTRTSVVEAQER